MSLARTAIRSAAAAGAAILVIGLAARGVTRAHLARLVPLAAKDFTGGTNPRPATEADYERLFLQAM